MTTTHQSRTARLDRDDDYLDATDPGYAQTLTVQTGSIMVGARGAAEREPPAPAPMPPSTRRPPTW